MGMVFLLLLGVFWIFSSFLQAVLLSVIYTGAAPKFLVPTLVVCGCIILATSLYILYLLVLAPSIAFTLETGTDLFLRAMLFCIIFGLMTFFAPLVNAWLISYSAYMFQDTGAIIIWPIMEWMVGLLIGGKSSGVALAYTVFFVVYTLILSGYVILKWRNPRNHTP